MPDFHYDHQKLADIYEIDCPWAADNDFYLSLAGGDTLDILDLGCGTGMMCAAYAKRGHRVTGVDPSPGMLAVARRKKLIPEIEWVKADAQTYRSHKRFDLIIMTGHAFQTLVSDDDVSAAFATMAQHLKADGRIVFESRNPTIDWQQIWHGEEQILKTPCGDVRKTCYITSTGEGTLSFDQTYQFPDETLTSHSKLRFMGAKEITDCLNRAELQTETIFGNWNRNEFFPMNSREMIFIVRQK